MCFPNVSKVFSYTSISMYVHTWWEGMFVATIDEFYHFRFAGDTREEPVEEEIELEFQS